MGEVFSEGGGKKGKNRAILASGPGHREEAARNETFNTSSGEKEKRKKVWADFCRKAGKKILGTKGGGKKTSSPGTKL